MNKLQRATRGKGLLESWLARMRARQANRLIPAHLREGRILDIGCGSYPYFLTHTYFSEKFAVDQMTPKFPHHDIEWFTLNLDSKPTLPFDDEFFSVVSMLAVVEHLDPSKLVVLLNEVSRTLIPNGTLVITTPAVWSNQLLKLMAKINLVSAEEIEDHVFLYTLPLLGWYFGKSGFDMQKIRFGYFEFLLNMWACAEK